MPRLIKGTFLDGSPEPDGIMMDAVKTLAACAGGQDFFGLELTPMKVKGFHQLVFKEYSI
jgi:hypothetical protein